MGHARPRGEGNRGWHRIGLGALAALVAILALPAAASANVPFATITATNPIRQIYLGNELSCQVKLSVDADLDFYPPGVAPGDCGTLVSIGATVYGPAFADHDSTAANDYTNYTPVSQTPVSGSGSAVDPYQVTTVVMAGLKLRLTETTTYVVGQSTFRSTIDISNVSAGPVNNVHLYRAGDCYLAGSDEGYGAINASGGVFCTASPDNSPAGRLIGFQPITAGSHYLETDFASVWDALDGTDLPDVADTTVFQDNGAALSWSTASLASGATTRFEVDNRVEALDPFGSVVGVTVNGDQAPIGLCPDLSCAQMQVTCNLPAGSAIPCDPFLTVLADLESGGSGRAPHGKATAATAIAGGQISLLPGETQVVSLPVSAGGQAALASQQQLAAKTKKKAKKDKQKAKKLQKKAKHADAAKAKKLKKKAKKLKKKAKKETKKAKALLNPSAQVTINNDRNGSTATISLVLAIP